MTDYFHPETDTEKLKQLSSLSLAHVGDCVFEMLVRLHVISGTSAQPDVLHKRTVELVRAEFQAKMCEVLIPFLDDEELAVVKRGRNAKHHTVPKHSSLKEYSLATALEALFGYLYLLGRKDRINQLFEIILSNMEDK